MVDLSLLYPPFKAAVDAIMTDMEALGHPLKVTQGLRTYEEQAALYAQGRTAPGKIVTNAKPGSSLHNYGLACDFCFSSQDPYGESNPWRLIGDMAIKHGCKWGGLFVHMPDRPHIENMYGFTLEEIQARYLNTSLTGLFAMIDAKLKTVGEI